LASAFLGSVRGPALVAVPTVVALAAAVGDSVDLLHVRFASGWAIRRRSCPAAVGNPAVENPGELGSG